MKIVRLDDLSDRLDARKAELGIVGDEYVAVNSGVRRTDSKRALLKAIRDVAERKGRPLKFPAKG